MIYYLEDDTQMRELVLYALERVGYKTRGFAAPSELFEAIDDSATPLPDLLLLDEVLPEQDGLSVLARLRAGEGTCDLPIMMVTGKDAEYDKVTGLDSGADDYLTKPFGMMELVSRVGALLRREERAVRRVAAGLRADVGDHVAGMSGGVAGATGGGAGGATGIGDVSAPGSIAVASDRNSQPLQVGTLALDPSRHEVTAAGAPVQLTNKEFELLHYLMAHGGLALTRRTLLERVWGYDLSGEAHAADSRVETRTVDAHILTLRKKLAEADPDAAALIETVRGVGYRRKDE